MELLQGNTYKINVEIKVDDSDIDINDIEKIQFTFGRKVEKIYDGENDDVTYAGNNIFVVKLTQEDTFKFDGTVDYQIRVKFKDGEVKGIEPEQWDILESITKEVL